MRSNTPPQPQLTRTPADGGWPRRSAPLLAFFTCVLIGLCMGAVYQTVLTAGYVSEEDYAYVNEVRQFKWPGWTQLGRLFELTFDPRRIHRPDNSGGYYQPLVSLSFMLDAMLSPTGADRVFQFHLTNLALHVVNVMLLFVLLYVWTRNIIVAALAAMFFGVHPVQVGAVAWIAQRMTLLGTFFCLLALLCYQRRVAASSDIRKGGASRYWMLASTVYYAAAILSKPQFIGLPVVLLLLDLWPLRRRGIRPVLEKIPMLLLAAGCLVIQLYIHSKVEPARAEAMLPSRLFAMNLGSFAASLLYPARLNAHYPINGPHQQALLVAGWTLVATLACVLMASFRLRPSLFVAAAGAAVLLLPAFLQLPFAGKLLGDGYLYPVCIVPLLIVGLALKNGPPLMSRPTGRCAALAVTGLCLFLAVQSHIYAYDWTSRRDLYNRTIRLYPRWAFGYTGLVEGYLRQGDLDSAWHYARRGVDADPKDPTSQFYMGRILLLLQDGRSREAVAPLKFALDATPHWIACLHYYGVALVESDRLDEGIARLEQARDLDQHAPAIRMDLGSAYLKAGRPASARAEFQRALEMRDDPDPLAHLGLAKSWAAAEMFDRACQHYQMAQSRGPQLAMRRMRSPLLRELENDPAFDALMRQRMREAGIETSDNAPSAIP